MPEKNEDNNHTSKINVFPVLQMIFFQLWGQKMDLFAPHGAMKSTLWPARRKNCYSFSFDRYRTTLNGSKKFFRNKINYYFYI